MPQLEISTYLSQFFWLITSFLSLWLVMAWVIIPKIEEVMEQRRRKIDDFVQKAEKINKQALISLEKYEKALKKAKENAQTAIDENKKELEQVIATRHLEIEELLNKKIADTEFMLAKERRETFVAIDEVSVNVAEQILNKLGIENVDTAVLNKSIGGNK
ncbi:MAG: hypothetical protein IJW75_00785 [Alphaproteobacteria bacterium]|nr:hypothetical protein [Alphaproteobacteria bacterium]